MTDENQVKEGQVAQQGSEYESDGENDLSDVTSANPLVEANRLFGSSCNMGGGGGIVTTDDEDSRVARNFKLIKSGAIGGAGMFAESYFLFAIGNLHTIWADLYPTCQTKQPDICPTSNWTTQDLDCAEGLTDSFTYIEVIGLMIGMLTFGYFADIKGRRWGSISTASFMFVGGFFSTVAWAGQDNLTGMFAVFATALFVFSYGVGGEYPLASASAAERAEAQREATLAARSRNGQASGPLHHIRGKAVIFTFAMQGLGNWFNTLVILVILIATGCTGDTTGCDGNCTQFDLELTWRLQYAIGTLFLLILLIGRVVYLKESQIWLKNKKKRALENERRAEKTLSGEPVEEQSRTKRLAFKHYWHRMVGTGIGWYVWDVVFYGNKLFQGNIIAIIIGGSPTLVEVLSYTLLNSTVALAGYYAAGFVVDKPWMGRRGLQTLGYFFIFVLFLISGVMFDTLTTPDGVVYLQTLYYLTSFFGQFGPNCTSWLLPSEVFPTDIRTMSHGLSATLGKLGALTATLLFTYGAGGKPFGPQAIFLTCAVCGLIGLVLTIVFIPDVTTMDLAATDERFRFIIDPTKDVRDYHGQATDPKYMSRYERWTGLSCDCPACVDAVDPQCSHQSAGKFASGTDNESSETGSISGSVSGSVQLEVI